MTGSEHRVLPRQHPGSVDSAIVQAARLGERSTRGSLTQAHRAAVATNHGSWRWLHRHQDLRLAHGFVSLDATLMAHWRRARAS